MNDMVSFSADEFSISLKTMNIDATKLLYALRPLINSRETGNTSLGINNILYVALILLLIEDDTIKTFLSGDLYRELIKQDHEHLLERSYEKSASSDDYALNLAALQDATLYDGLYAFFSDFVPTANGITILAVEEPESHLHPIYQRLLYRHIMNKTNTSVIITTHSTHISSVAPITSLVHLITTKDGTEVKTTAGIDLSEDDYADLTRYISEDDYFLLKRTIFQTLTASKVYKDNLSEWLCYLDKKVGIVSAFTASERYPDEIDNYNKLLETARSHDTQLTIKFLTRLGIPENQVVLTTRHSSKGLEFDVVILPGMEKDSFPSYYDNTPRKLAEARRLCFVSVSRARKACILIRSKNLQNQYGRWFSKEPSPFWVALQEFQDSRSDY